MQALPLVVGHQDAPATPCITSSWRLGTRPRKENNTRSRPAAYKKLTRIILIAEVKFIDSRGDIRRSASCHILPTEGSTTPACMKSYKSSLSAERQRLLFHCYCQSELLAVQCQIVTHAEPSTIASMAFCSQAGGIVSPDGMDVSATAETKHSCKARCLEAIADL